MLWIMAKEVKLHGHRSMIVTIVTIGSMMVVMDIMQWQI